MSWFKDISILNVMPCVFAAMDSIEISELKPYCEMEEGFLRYCP